jgi:hypothetical protein
VVHDGVVVILPDDALDADPLPQAFPDTAQSILVEEDSGTKCRNGVGTDDFATVPHVDPEGLGTYGTIRSR